MWSWRLLMTPCCRSTVTRHGRKTTTGCCTRSANRFDHPIYRSAAGTLNVVPTVHRRVDVCSAFSDVAGAWHCRYFLPTPPMRSPRAQIADPYVSCVWEQGRQAAATKKRAGMERQPTSRLQAGRSGDRRAGSARLRSSVVPIPVPRPCARSRSHRPSYAACRRGTVLRAVCRWHRASGCRCRRSPHAAAGLARP